MIDLSPERMDRILHEETPKKEAPDTVLRSVYIRYMRLYEQYFADIDALTDDRIAELRRYSEETWGLVRCYYMDIPQDVCLRLREFEDACGGRLLGPGWRPFLHDSYASFCQSPGNGDKSAERMKAAFEKEALSSFYDAMDYVFRDGFGTGSRTAETLVSGLTGLLFGKDK